MEQRVAARQCAGLCRTLADNARHGGGDFRLRALVAAVGELRLQLCNFRAGSLHIRLRRFQTQTLLVKFLRCDRALVGQRAIAVERRLCLAPFRLPRIQVRARLGQRHFALPQSSLHVHTVQPCQHLSFFHALPDIGIHFQNLQSAQSRADCHVFFGGHRARQVQGRCRCLLAHGHHVHAHGGIGRGGFRIICFGLRAGG